MVDYLAYLEVLLKKRKKKRKENKKKKKEYLEAFMSANEGRM